MPLWVFFLLWGLGICQVIIMWFGWGIWAIPTMWFRGLWVMPYRLDLQKTGDWVYLCRQPTKFVWLSPNKEWTLRLGCPWLEIVHVYCHTLMPESNAILDSMGRRHWKIYVWNSPQLCSTCFFSWLIFMCIF